MSEQQALLSDALYFALTAPSDRQCDEAVALAELLAAGLTPEQITAAKTAAEKRWSAKK